MIATLTVGALLLLYSAISGRLARHGVTSAMAFVVAGVVTGAAGLGWLDVPLESRVVERLAEFALVFLLFSDSCRIDLGSLRRSLRWPSRLLLLGLPMTILAGLGAGLLVFPGLSVASVFLLSTMLCSTDAALGQRVVEDPAVPPRVRQALDVESGLNDGLAVPFFLVAADLSMANLTGGVSSAVLHNIAAQIGWGVLAGLAAGAAGGWLRSQSEQRGWLEPQWRQTFTFAVALSAYAGAVALGGSGFIAAFVAGLAFAATSRQDVPPTIQLSEQVGGILAAVTWMGFGALAISKAWPDITWQVVLYAVLSLTAVRMIPVALAMVGSGARRQTVAFIGWFGPRGLASVVFGLLALERGVPHAGTLLATVVVAVGLSVFLHGLSAGPLVGAYDRWYTRQSGPTSASAEARPTAMPRPRPHAGATHNAEAEPGLEADGPDTNSA